MLSVNADAFTADSEQDVIIYKRNTAVFDFMIMLYQSGTNFVPKIKLYTQTYKITQIQVQPDKWMQIVVRVALPGATRDLATVMYDVYNDQSVGQFHFVTDINTTT